MTILRETKSSFLERMGTGLAKTRHFLSRQIKAILPGRTVDEGLLDRLMEVFIASDMGVAVTERLIAALKESLPNGKGADYEVLKEKLKRAIRQILEKESPLPLAGTCELVISLFVGVNGVGKTTTIGKVAARLKQGGKQVLLAAGDTFRAGAIQQLLIWGERVGAEVIHLQPGADPSAVAFNAIQAALAQKVDALLIDTAGRLHTHHNLMEELKKMTRVMAKQAPGAAREQVLVLDATTGQNALSQAKQFQEAIGINSLIMTKLDAEARGGILVSVVEQLQVPVAYLGVGEGVADLIPFQGDSFVEALFEEPAGVR